MKEHINRSAVKNTFLIFLLLAITNLPVFAAPHSDPYENVFLYAKTLEQGGAYEQAELEYKRYIFLQDYSAGIHQTEAFTALAGLYEKNSQWELAAQTMYKAILSDQQDKTTARDNSPAALAASDATSDKFKIDHIRYLENSPEKSNFSFTENLFIFSYLNLPDFSDTVKQYAYLSAIEKDLKDDRTENAATTFSVFKYTFPDFFTIEDSAAISSGFEKIETYKPKKQMLAGYLSLFPGLGQLYAGNYKDSLNAFLLNGSIIAVSAYSIFTLDLWTFSLLEFNPLLHFMKGNIYNAQKDVYEYNSRHLQEYKEEILNIIHSAKAEILENINTEK